MSDVAVSFGADFEELRKQLGGLGEEIKRMEKSGAGRSIVAGMDRARASAGRTSAAYAQATTRTRGFFSGFRGAARATAGIVGLTVAGVALSRRYPAIGQVAGKSFATLTQGARGAVGATANAARSIGNLRMAATAAVGIYSLGKAFQNLRGSAAGAAQATQMGGAGGRGGMFGQILGGTMLGNLAADGIKTAVRTAWSQAMGALGGSADMEQTKITFGVMLGDTGAADKLVGEIQQRAAKTPLETHSLLSATKTLMGFSVEAKNLLPTLDMLGDVSGGNAEKLQRLAFAFGKVMSNGRLMGEEVLQFIEASGFNPLDQISKRTGESMPDVRKRMETGGISSDEVVQAFQDATSAGGRYFQMLLKQSKSATGLASTLKDAWALNLLEFGKPVLESIKPLLTDAIGLVEKMRDGATQFGERVAYGLDFVRAAFMELSGGELLEMAGKGLQIAFMEAVNFLARGLQAVFAVASESDFAMDLEAKLVRAAEAFRKVMLEGVEQIFLALKDTPFAGFEARKVANNLRQMREGDGSAGAVGARAGGRVGGGERVEKSIAEMIKEEFAKAGGIFDTGKSRAKFEEFSARVEAAMEKDRQARAGSGGNGGTGPGEDDDTDAEKKTFNAGGMVAGGLANALSRIAGGGDIVMKNQLAVAKKTADATEETAKAAAATAAAAKQIAINTNPRRGGRTVTATLVV